MCGLHISHPYLEGSLAYETPHVHCPRLHPHPTLLGGTLLSPLMSRAWEIRREAWRRLRHDRALGYLRADLTAPNFTNPCERVALFRDFKNGQTLRHARRVALLQDLCSRRPGADKEVTRHTLRKIIVSMLGVQATQKIPARGVAVHFHFSL